MNMKHLPTDLIIEIFSRLPAKSVNRFHTLSKQWCSILRRQDFIDLFGPRARPRLLFAVERKGLWSFFSAPQPSSSLVVTADFHSRISGEVSRFACSYASALFHFEDLWKSEVGTEVSVVCNPITGRYMILPYVYKWRHSTGFLGFDPIGKEFKVLAEGYPACDQTDHHAVLTLGTGELSWRSKGMETPHYYETECVGLCINGVLYYLVEHCMNTAATHSIVRFDVRSEEFKLFTVNGFSNPKKTRLVNYKSKIGWIEWEYGEDDGKYFLDLWLYVLEDVEEEEWSEYEYSLPENKLMGDTSKVSVAGVTATGEIVLTLDYTCKPYYVFYFNPESNTLQSVETQGFGAVEYRGKVTAFLDHVEDLNFDDAVQLKSKEG